MCPYCQERPLCVPRGGKKRLGKTCGTYPCISYARMATRQPDFKAMAIKGNQSRMRKGRRLVIRPVELELMTKGRYNEAARLLLDRGYNAGWVGCKRGARQMPWRTATR